MSYLNIWGSGLEDLEPVVDDNPAEVVDLPEAETDVLVAAAEADDAVADLIDAEIVSDTADEAAATNFSVLSASNDVAAALEELRDVPMTRAVARHAVYNAVRQATRGMYDVSGKMGSMESFGDEAPSSVLIGHGLEGLDGFIKKLKERLQVNLKQSTLSLSEFLEAFTVSTKSVSKRAQAVLDLAKTVSREPSTSSIQLEFKHAVKMSLGGRLATGIPGEISKISKLSKVVFQDHTKRVNESIDDVSAYFGKFTGMDFDQANKHYEKLTSLAPVQFIECKTKEQSKSGPTVNVSRSYELLGGKCFVSETYLPKSTGNACQDAFDYATVAVPNSRNSIQDLSNRVNTNMDLSMKTLKPAEIIRIAEEVVSLMKELENNTIKKTIFAELMERLDVNDGGYGVSQVLVKGTDGGEDTKVPDAEFARFLGSIEDAMYGFITMYTNALTSLPKDYISYATSEANAALAVCERSLACYPELVGSKIGENQPA
jgi:hypothetical protein